MSGSPSVFTGLSDVVAAAPAAVQSWVDANGETLIATPIRIALIVVLAAVLRLLVNRGIRRLTERTASGIPSLRRPRRPTPPGDGGEPVAERRAQRAEAIGSVLRSFASFVILGIAVVLVLG